MVGLSPLLSEKAKPCTGTPYSWGGMKCIFSGTSIEMPGNDALRLAMISDVPCFVDKTSSCDMCTL